MTWRLLDQAEVARHERQSGHDAEELPQVIVAAVRRAGGGLPGWVANQCIRHDFGEQDVYFAGAQAMPFPNGGPQQHPSIFSQQVRRQHEPKRPGQHAIQHAANR